MAQFEGFDHADVRVRDLAAVEAFYDRLMPLIGLPQKRRAFVDEDGEWRDPVEGERENVVEYYEAGGKGSRFFGVIEDRATPPTRTRIAFRLPQESDWRTMPDLLAQIGAQSVELSADPQTYQAIFFEDPAGTRLEVCWRHHELPR